MTRISADISVIICAYTERRWQQLYEAVVSAWAQTVPPQEVIVVIDHNPALLRQAQTHLPAAIVIENTGARGASGSRNSGVAIAQSGIVAFLDDDAIADTHWLEQLVTRYRNPVVAGIGGRIEPHWLEKRPGWFPDEFLWVVGCTYKGIPTQSVPVRNVIGANMSVRRDALLAVGGFRESFGNTKDATYMGKKWLRHQAGDEETELCIRITQSLPEHHWFYMPSAIVMHRIPAQRAQLSYFLWRCYDEGLGKALLTMLHTQQVGLSSERVYILFTLPKGIIRGIMDTISHGDIGGLGRAGAIIAGLTATTVGYGVGRLCIGAPGVETSWLRFLSRRVYWSWRVMSHLPFLPEWSVETKDVQHRSRPTEAAIQMRAEDAMKRSRQVVSVGAKKDAMNRSRPGSVGE